MSTESTLASVAIEGAKDEYTDYTVYKRLASSTSSKNPKLADVFSKLADTELRHYNFWKKFSPPSVEIKVNSAAVYLVLFLRLIFGATFAIKFLERRETTVIKRYKSVAHLIPVEDKAAFDEMVRDEEEHENGFANQVQSSYIKYISFIVLGLADAIVEISGIHAGSLGIYSSTELTGLAGIVAGAAASIAMASAAYAQAKQGFQGSASVSAVFTGISYFVNAVILAMPYFLTRNMANAITLSMIFAVIIIAFITYYNSIVSGGRFTRDFLELAGIMFGATAALYFFGLLIRTLFGITI